MDFVTVSAASAEARWAMTQYFDELATRFPGGFDPGAALDEAPAQYDPPNGVFVVARSGTEVVGCGALALLDADTAEIKRMWVSSASRGVGLGRRLLAHLEDLARQAGRTTVALDTNGTLAEAIALYESAGYVATDRYNDNPYAERWYVKQMS